MKADAAPLAANDHLAEAVGAAANAQLGMGMFQVAKEPGRLGGADYEQSEEANHGSTRSRSHSLFKS